MSDQRAATAARNNAEWCDKVCRSHGITTRWYAEAWTSATRSPPLYPDTVTLVPNLSVDELLARIDASPGCSIKDSFASLDLTDQGFRVLFGASWIARTGAAPSPVDATTRWTVLREAHGLARWEEAWRGGIEQAGTFRTGLLHDPAVVVLAGLAPDNRIVDGVVLNRSADAVGISNVFTERPGDWSGWLAVAASLFPSTTLVGYESGDELDLAQHHGFGIVGSLRVWIRDA